MARRRRKMDEGEVEANLIPVMNVMFLLIPALLMAMEVAHFTAIAVSPPKYAVSDAEQDPQEEEEEKEEPLNFKVFITSEGFGLQSGPIMEPETSVIALAKAGADVRTDFSAFDYAELEAKARELKRQFPGEKVVTVSAIDDIPMQTLVFTMDALRGSNCKLIQQSGSQVDPDCMFWNTVVDAGAN